MTTGRINQIAFVEKGAGDPTTDRTAKPGGEADDDRGSRMLSDKGFRNVAVLSPRRATGTVPSVWVADRTRLLRPCYRVGRVRAVPVVRSLPASSLRGQTFRTVEASYRKAGHVRQGSRDCVTVSRCGSLAGSANFAAGRALSCH